MIEEHLHFRLRQNAINESQGSQSCLETLQIDAILTAQKLLFFVCRRLVVSSIFRTSLFAFLLKWFHKVPLKHFRQLIARHSIHIGRARQLLLLHLAFILDLGHTIFLQYFDALRLLLLHLLLEQLLLFLFLLLLLFDAPLISLLGFFFFFLPLLLFLVEALQRFALLLLFSVVGLILLCLQLDLFERLGFQLDGLLLIHIRLHSNDLFRQRLVLLLNHILHDLPVIVVFVLCLFLLFLFLARI
mmetsp:Transcript_40718/g.65387  ORF Transcript_40718/g.65387 Transcript_40718/m.65387 type:complete len:244 (-) Transcript_40718:900-1631(-)